MQWLTLRWLLVQGGKKAIKDTFEKNEKKKRETVGKFEYGLDLLYIYTYSIFIT